MDLAVLQKQVNLIQKDGNKAVMGYSDSKFVDKFPRSGNDESLLKDRLAQTEQFKPGMLSNQAKSIN